MIVIMLNLAIIFTIILVLICMYARRCRKDYLYIKECAENNMFIELKVFERLYKDGIINSSCLISAKIGDKNIIYNKNILKKLFNCGPKYFLVDGFEREDQLNEALTAFIEDYSCDFGDVVIIKV